MNRTTTLLLFSVTFAVAIGSLSYGIYATSSTTSLPKANNAAMTVLGHVEYTVRGPDNQVKAYVQSDNLVVNQGDNCVAARLFDLSSTQSHTGCTGFTQGFNFIGIGNKTSQFDDNVRDGLGPSATQTDDGELARIQDTTPLITASSGNSTSGAIVVIETPTPFAFTTLGPSGTTIKNSGLFNSSTVANGSTDDRRGVFSIQKLSSTVAVTNLDTLNVRWTITIGGADAQSGP
jgi:hypothetical protein